VGICMPLGHTLKTIRLELAIISRRKFSQKMVQCCSAERWRVPVSRREEVLVPTPGDGRRHHSTAPTGARLFSSS
jgi:hypothetical protein